MRPPIGSHRRAECHAGDRIAPSVSPGARRSSRSPRAAPSSIAGPNGSSPRRPIRRAGEQHEGEQRLDDEAGGGARRRRRPSRSSPGRARAGRPASRRPCPARAARSARGRGRRRTAPPRPAPPAAGRPSSRPAAAATSSRTAPIPIEGTTTRLGSRWCWRSTTASSTPARPGRGRPAAPRRGRTGARRARTAAPSRPRRRAGGRAVPAEQSAASAWRRATGSARRRDVIRKPARTPSRPVPARGPCRHGAAWGRRARRSP